MKTLNQILKAVTLKAFSLNKINNQANGSKPWVTDGFINVNIEGTTRDGIEIKESFIADQLYARDLSNSNSFWINIQNDGKTSFNLKRSINGQMSTWVFISFCMGYDLISDENIQIQASRRLGKKKVLDLLIMLDDSGNHPNLNPITNVKFDQKSQMVSGDFKFKDSALNISGDFNMKIVQRVM